LRGPLPFDLSASDIPVWFVGRGIIADRLHSHPGSFNVPSRREAVKVLRHFDHRHVPARGKGSHEQWVAPDQRAFVLPTRNPLSRVVFSSMLHHLGIDKKTYVRDIRPKL
jgi:predicted RNA binding protein YcfA (HicA-like mRNA interferase family)